MYAAEQARRSAEIRKADTEARRMEIAVGAAAHGGTDGGGVFAALDPLELSAVPLDTSAGDGGGADYYDDGGEKFGCLFSLYFC